MPARNKAKAEQQCKGTRKAWSRRWPASATTPEQERHQSAQGNQPAGAGLNRNGLIFDDLVDPGNTACVVREMVDTFITEVSEDTWIFFPWDLDVAYVAPILGGTH